ncbi:MAG: 50S ribosomal protein L17 [Myxococcales bacterium]|jgi:large subunit ribosomal protein L17|nr:50S ribosomal protein L17 [Myxococcales bacterium]
MRHRIVGRKLNRSRSHYHSLMDNLITSMLKHESITTTLPKAKELRPLVEKLITLGKEDSVHARRMAFKTVRQKDVLKKLFSDIGPRMKERQGGYTRILKMGFRRSDAAPMAIIQLVDYVPKAKPSKAAVPASEAGETAAES